MSSIKVLDENLANQIAAGEVVERPASVVKELVENALDAGAKNIQVTLEEAGLKLIQVLDDGAGIPREEVKIAFERHATSKIENSEELFRIRTLGFRGEALPSIASVSHLSIETAQANQPGIFVHLEGGEIVEEKTAPARKGTKVTVEQLFYNTPARLKHIKTLQTELSHVTDLMNRFALARYDVSFELIHDGNVLLKTIGNNDQRQAIAGVYGVPAAKKMKKISAEDFNFKVEGYVSLPELTRANNKYVTFVINGRYVKDFRLNKALEAGYGSKLMVGRHPIGVVQVTLDPLLVDVNVHPTKQYVRISIEDELGELIKGAVEEAMSETVRVPKGLDNIHQTKIKAEPMEQTAFDFQSQTHLEENKWTFQEEPPMSNYFENEDSSHEEMDAMITNEEVKEQHPTTDILDLVSREKAQQPVEHVSFPSLEYIGQLHGTYLLAQNEDGLYLIDQHAAQERIKYEYYRQTIGSQGTAQQDLLLSVMLEYPTDEAIIIKNNLDKLAEAGIYLEDFGGNTFVLRQHPSWIASGVVEETAQEMIDFFLENERLSMNDFREATAIMMSCKRSIKANHYLTEAEARQLLIDLEKAENPYNCPHGRPTAVLLTNYDIEKMFKRIQD